MVSNMTKYVVYGYYSRADVGQYPSYIDEFDTQQKADECVIEFEKCDDRCAWVEEE